MIAEKGAKHREGATDDKEICLDNSEYSWSRHVVACVAGVEGFRDELDAHSADDANSALKLVHLLSIFEPVTKVCIDRRWTQPCIFLLIVVIVGE